MPDVIVNSLTCCGALLREAGGNDYFTGLQPTSVIVTNSWFILGKSSIAELSVVKLSMLAILTSYILNFGVTELNLAKLLQDVQKWLPIILL